MKLHPALVATITSISGKEPTPERQQKLQPIIAYLQQKIKEEQPLQLHFICTHNSRRSQLAQVWAKSAAVFYSIDVSTFSGGTEVTACHDHVISTLKADGFTVAQSGSNNPKFRICSGLTENDVVLYSKAVDAPENPKSGFAAVMTCSDAEENCPFIFGAEQRVSLPYEDPKKFDNTAVVAEKYKERSRQIAQEMLFVFSKINY